jgi:hypothetical protein
MESDSCIERIEGQAQSGGGPDHLCHPCLVLRQQLERQAEGAYAQCREDRDHGDGPRQPAPCSCPAGSHFANISLGEATRSRPPRDSDQHDVVLVLGVKRVRLQPDRLAGHQFELTQRSRLLVEQ